MPRLDDHVSAVRNRMALNLFIIALGWLSAGLAAVVLLAVLLDRIFLLYPPRPDLWLYGGAAGIVVAAVAYAFQKRPDPRQAAVPIDQKLGLKERISTALYIRSSDDPFAQATIRDAEEAARGIVLNMGLHFSLVFPKPVLRNDCRGTGCGPVLFHDRTDELVGRKERAEQQAAQQREVEQARRQVEKAYATVSAIPPSCGRYRGHPPCQK